ncbi:MAG: hypothetical protein OXH04_10870 [Acidobacteria bacterium]|nr:hypothetical protein [Acidobacteriota bacterium]
MFKADDIRSHAAETYVAPARRRGDETVAIVARDVLRDLNLPGDRAAAVCSALRAAKFRKEHSLDLLRVDGPPSKRSTTTTFTFRIPPVSVPGDRPARNAIWKLRGAGKATFAALGGGERWLRRERESFDEADRSAGARDRGGSSE